jgi:hypothetical protein
MVQFCYISITWLRFTQRFLNFANILGKVIPKFWSAPSLPVTTGLKKGYKTGVSSSDHFVLTLGFLWIWSSKPNLAEEEKERKEAMQTDRNEIPEDGKTSSNLYKWKPINFYHFLYDTKFFILCLNAFLEEV